MAAPARRGECGWNTAIGSIADPAPFGTAWGHAVRKSSQRPSSPAVRARSWRPRLSNKVDAEGDEGEDVDGDGHALDRTAFRLAVVMSARHLRMAPDT